MCSDWLDLHPATVPAADDYIRALMTWHFSAETGSPYWLRRRETLDFDPIADVQSFDDLTRFPNVVNEFREVAIEDLIPRGVAGERIAGVYESGGTTGAPKRFVMFDEWMDWVLGWDEHHYAPIGTTNTLAITPSGPHMFGEFATRRAQRHNGVKFTIDFDPRWIKHLIATGGDFESYAEHLIDQAAHILQTQQVGILITTPPLLERLARRDELVELVRKNIKFICWSGAHMDADTRDILRGEVFPGIPMKGLYGSTTILGMSRERDEERPDGLPVFDAPSPFVAFRVVDPATGKDVAYGERGQVVMNLLTKWAFIPNNLERDLAMKAEPAPGALGCAVADVSPVTSFDNNAVIEGVY